MAHDPLHLRGEPVVGHAVGLVEHEDLHRRQVDLAALDEVDQAQRRGDDEVDTLVEGIDLIVAARPAVHGEHPPTGMLGDRGEHLGDLQGQLAGGHEHEPERSPRLGLIGDSRQHRHAEGERLARAGARPPAEVVAFDGDGNRRPLYLERLGEARCGEPDVDALGHAELGEAGGWFDRRESGGGGDRRMVDGLADRPRTAASTTLARRACVAWGTRHVAPTVATGTLVPARQQIHAKDLRGYVRRGSARLPARLLGAEGPLRRLLAGGWLCTVERDAAIPWLPPPYVGRAPHIRVRPYPPPPGRGVLHFSHPSPPNPTTSHLRIAMPPQPVTPRKMPFDKYQPWVPIVLADRTWPDQRISKAPLWCSVDLRDGNQALIDPMDPVRKRTMFTELVNMGFKEIEVGFPAASQPDFDFIRQLIEEDLIPDDVTIQVLVQCRQELLERTYECIAGAPKAIMHFYNSTNPLQREVVFGLDKEGIVDIAINAARIACKLEDTIPGTAVRYEYSPESFTLTEPDFAVEICERVMDVVEPTPDQPDHSQPAGHRRVLHGKRLRRRHRVVRPHDPRSRRRSCSPCIRTTTAARASPPPSSG